MRAQLWDFAREGNKSSLVLFLLACVFIFVMRMRALAVAKSRKIAGLPQVKWLNLRWVPLLFDKYSLLGIDHTPSLSWYETPMCAHFYCHWAVYIPVFLTATLIHCFDCAVMSLAWLTCMRLSSVHSSFPVC